MLQMEQPESPMSSDSAHTPLQDEHISSDLVTTNDNPVNLEIGETDMIEEQLDYEEFVENNEETKIESEAEEGEYNSSDNDDIICIADSKKSLENGEINSDEDGVDEDKKSEVKVVAKNGAKTNSSNINEGYDSDVVISEEAKCDGELAEGELKAEDDEHPVDETPWERGLRLARERRELAKLKKAQEKDKFREKQLNMNLDHMEEVEPITKPQIETSYEVNQKLLKAMQPIVILPEEPRLNEMILEYYLAESDYQHRPRFIPSRLYTLDPWEVEEWKRELDMMKMENEMERITSNKYKRGQEIKQTKRAGRRGSVSSSVSSRSSSLSTNKAAFNQSNRSYQFQTSQYALSRNKPILDKIEKASANDSTIKLHIHRGRRDLPPEFKNRMISSSRSSSRSSSASHSSSSSSSTSRSSSSARGSPKKRPAIITLQKSIPPPYRTIRKPALGRARSDSSASSKSSDSSSSTSDSSTSRSSVSSGNSRKVRKQKTDKQFINSWYTKPSINPLEATVVSDLSHSSMVGMSSAAINSNKTGSTSHPNGPNDITNASSVQPVVAAPVGVDECELPSASSRPGVKLKLLSRPKPVILPSQSSKSSSKPTSTKDSKKASALKTSSTAISAPTVNNVMPSSIFNNNKSIFTTSGTTNQKSSEIPVSAKESTMKSNLAATQLEMQQEFLRNYKDKIAIYRSQLSYQQQNPLSGQHPGTLTHTQPPPIKGPITVMSVTSKKTGPPKTQVKVTDRYSQHEEHSRRYNHYNYSPNYRNEFRSDKDNSNTGTGRNRHGSRNRSRSFENRNNNWEKPTRDYSRDRNHEYGDKFRPTSSSDGFRGRGDYNNNNTKYRDHQYDKFDRSDRNRFDPDRTRNEYDRPSRYDRGDDRTRRFDDRNNSGNVRNRDVNNRIDRQPRDRYRDNNKYRDDNYEPRKSSRGFNDFDAGSPPDSQWPERDNSRHRDDSYGARKSSRPHNTDQHHHQRDGLSDSVGGSAASAAVSSLPDDTSAAAAATKTATLPPVSAVPKEKRREELLKQLKAVEDAIAKKKAKIDK